MWLFFQILGLAQYARLSASCPSLNNEAGSDPDLLGSVNSSPTHAAPVNNFIAPGFVDILQRKGKVLFWGITKIDMRV